MFLISEVREVRVTFATLCLKPLLKNRVSLSLDDYWTLLIFLHFV